MATENRLIDANALLEKYWEMMLGGYVTAQDVRYAIESAPTVDAVEVVQSLWIPVSEKFPDEHDSIFAKLYGTKSWLPGMFRTVSDTVLVSIERKDGTSVVRAMHTQGGEWNLDSMPWAKKITHWMPLPAPAKDCPNCGAKMDGDGDER